MAAENARPLLSLEGVTVDFTPSRQAMGDVCSVELHTTQLNLVSRTCRLSVPFSNIKTINLHQPIFGANYIVGEYVHQGQSCSFTLTFKKGGATDFTRLLFRLTEGQLQQDPPDTAQPQDTSGQQHIDSKKNR